MLQVSRAIHGFRFGPFELDSDSGELRNNGTPVHLQPQPTQILKILLENHGKLVTREEIQQELWSQQTFVEFEVGLNQAIKKLREAIGDSAQTPTYIETIARKGYRFIAEVQEIEHDGPGDRLLGRVLGHYRMVERIGQGGMGVVYRAHDEHLNRDVAVKILPQGSVADEKSRRRFRKEAMALSKLNHPNIASVYDFDSYNGVDFLVQELISGSGVEQMLAKGPLPEEQIVALGTQLCEGLSAAHGQGVIHLDLKPANLRVADDGRLKILDFGLANVLHTVHGDSDKAPTESVVESQHTSGTLPYMAPEQLLNGKRDARTDIWGTGCVLYEIATGKLPFSGTGVALADNILHQPPTPPSQLNCKLTSVLESIILKCLEKDPTLRYASTRDIALDLKRSNLQPVPIPIATAIPRTRRAGTKWLRTVVAVTVVLSMSSVAFGVWWYLIRELPKRTVVVMHFQNRTQDSSFDWLNRGLSELVTADLAQVKGLDVVSSGELAEAAKSVDPASKPISNGSETLKLAQRAGADVYVTGSFVKAGPSGLRVDVQVHNAKAGRILNEAHAESEYDNHIFKLVDRITVAIAREFVRSRSIEAKPPDIEEGFTANLGAFRHFLAGVEFHDHTLFADAVKELEEAVRIDPDFAQAHMALWSVMLSGADVTPNERSAQAQRVQRLLWKLPRDLQLGYQANIAAFSGDEDAASKVAETAVKEFPRNVYHRRAHAAYLTTTRNYEYGIKVLQEGLKLAPDDSRLTDSLIDLYIRSGNLEGALKSADRLLALHPSDYNRLWVRAFVLSAAGRTEEAIADLRKAIELEGGNEHLDQDLVRFYADSGQFDLARRELSKIGKSIDSSRRTRALSIITAHLQQQEGDFQGAISSYRAGILAARSVGRNQGTAIRLVWLARISMLLGQSEAAATLRLARDQDLGGFQFRAIAELEAALGHDDASERALQRFAESQPGISTAAINRLRAVNRATSALRRNDGREALIALQNVRYTWLSPSPFDLSESWLAFLRARGHQLAREYSQAEEQFKACIEVRHSSLITDRSVLSETLSRFYLAEVYEDSGKRDQAVTMYRSFLDAVARSRPQLPQTAKARAALKRLGA